MKYCVDASFDLHLLMLHIILLTGRHVLGEKKYAPSPLHKHRKNPTRKKSSDAPFVCVACRMKTEMYIKESMRFTYSEIQLATDQFSKDNLLGEGGYGHVYRGELEDGQLIAAKVRKESSTQGFKEFNSEVYVLSFAHHKNIVMLLGYCCKENINILVYEFICNKSLEWHLFGKQHYSPISFFQELELSLITLFDLKSQNIFVVVQRIQFLIVKNMNVYE